MLVSSSRRGCGEQKRGEGDRRGREQRRGWEKVGEARRGDRDGEPARES